MKLSNDYVNKGSPINNSLENTRPHKNNESITSINLQKIIRKYRNKTKDFKKKGKFLLKDGTKNSHYKEC